MASGGNGQTPLRLGIDITAFPVGGQERQVAQLTRGLAERGHQVLLLINKGGDAFAETLDHPGIRVERLGRMGRWDLRVVTDIARELGAFKPDALLCVGYNATLWGRLVAAWKRIPMLTAEHESLRARRRSDIAFTNRVFGSSTRAIVACAEGQLPYLVADGNPADKIVVIRNGVDPRAFSPRSDLAAEQRRAWGVPEGGLVVGMVAAHRPEKRHDRFFRLIEACVADGVDVYGVMVGGGQMLEANRICAARSEAADRLVVAGPSSDLPAVYAACDLAVLCSDGVEVFPLSFLEAQACGVPVVGFDLGGVGETMIVGETGYLLPEGAEDLMLLRVLELLGDEDKRRAMGEAGRAWVSRELTVDAMVSAYETLVRRAISPR